jgi:hypothetical protein
MEVHVSEKGRTVTSWHWPESVRWTVLKVVGAQVAWHSGPWCCDRKWGQGCRPMQRDLWRTNVTAADGTGWRQRLQHYP